MTRMKECVGRFGSKECTWILCNDYNKCQVKYWQNKLDKKYEGISKEKIKEMIKFRKNLLNNKRK